jgi:manganese transport protein
LKNFLSKIGPGAIVSAAFIGPGTVTTSTLCGAQYGYTLLWTVTFSIILTLVLQEMSVRLGIMGGVGLGDAILSKTSKGPYKWAVIGFVFITLMLGNMAYEAGNITGAVLGFDSYPKVPHHWMTIGVSIAAFCVLFFGKYKQVELILVFLVGAMGIVFTVLAMALQPNYTEILTSLFVPTFPPNSLLMIMSIIGTTVVPYNLFLHASSVSEKWQGKENLTLGRWDSAIGILIGGLITVVILVTSKVIFQDKGVAFNKAADLVVQLKPALGDWAQLFIALGYLFAGFASTITAPLAASLATAELFGWKKSWRTTRFRVIWMVVLLTGFVFSSIGIKPVKLILFAQWSNGILLPFISLFLLWIMNDSKIMGNYVNKQWENIISIILIVSTFVLAYLTLTNIK